MKASDILIAHIQNIEFDLQINYAHNIINSAQIQADKAFWRVPLKYDSKESFQRALVDVLNEEAQANVFVHPTYEDMDRCLASKYRHRCSQCLYDDTNSGVFSNE